MRSYLVLGSLSLLLSAVVSVAYGGDESDPVGEPKQIAIDFGSITLAGPRATQQLLVTGTYDDSSVRDLTRAAKYQSKDDTIATVDEKGVVHPKGNGSTEITAKVGEMEAKSAVSVSNFEKPSPVNFHHEVVPAMTRAGCNSGACHGTPSGKNGFRLSLQGYLPDQDINVLTREMFGRRLNRNDPENSLLLLKGTARIPHEGGRRFGPDQEAYQVVKEWIAEGTNPPAGDGVQFVKLEVFPKSRLLRGDSTRQQIVAQAVYSDGSRRDVTPLVAFSTSDPSTAEVSKNGLVTFKDKGSVAVLCRYLHAVENSRLSYLRETPGFVWSNPPTNNYVDDHVFAKLAELQILPSDVCSDAEFVRRVHLDVAGILPTPERVQAFLADQDPNKRAKLVDEIVERPEYAEFWGMKWADILRSTRKQITYRGSHNFRRYLVDVFAKNRPINEFVTELITSTGDTMISPAANYYRVARDPQECAESTAQLFMGVRMQCAKCHNHPFERWTQDDYYGLAACFARVGHKKPTPESEAEVIFVARGGEVNHLRTGKVMPPKGPGSGPFTGDPNADRRELLAKWLVSPENPFFAKSIVNRIWYHMNGKGIVEPVDDFRDSNPPRNEALLDALAKDFVEHGYDFKRIVRAIANSRTYQLSARTNPTNATDEKYFSHASTRLLSAEVLLDAISSSTGVPEKFAGLPAGTRAVQLPDPEVNHEFLQAFGQPSRELVCECARESETTLTQALNLINGDVVHAKLSNPQSRVKQLLANNSPDPAIIESLYMATLSRSATPAEQEASTAHITKIGDRARALEDIHWALLNCKEFLFRH